MPDAKKEFHKIPMKIAFKVGDDFEFDCYIRLSESKIIKISNTDDIDLLETLQRYHDKGIDFFYAEKEAYLKFVQQYNKNFSQKFFDPKTTTEEKVDLLNQSHSLVKESLVKIGVTPDVIAMAQNLSKTTNKFLKKVPNISTFYQEFKDKCSEEFIKSMTINYIATSLTGQFEWATVQVKQKLSLAVLLCDITLTPEDFKLLNENLNTPDLLPEHIYNHPHSIAKLLSEGVKNGIPSEVLQVIEQHHENATGTGFPSKIGYTRFSMLSAIYIVSARFVEQAIEEDFNFQKLGDIINNIWNDYHQGNFKKVVKVLNQMFNLNK